MNTIHSFNLGHNFMYYSNTYLCHRIHGFPIWNYFHLLFAPCSNSILWLPIHCICYYIDCYIIQLHVGNEKHTIVFFLRKLVQQRRTNVMSFCMQSEKRGRGLNLMQNDVTSVHRCWTNFSKIHNCILLNVCPFSWPIHIIYGWLLRCSSARWSSSWLSLAGLTKFKARKSLLFHWRFP